VATTVNEIVAELLAARTSARQGRLIDKDEAGAMEKKRRSRKAISNGEPTVERRNRCRASSAGRLCQRGSKGVLRFLTCGSVDGGKSTLIGPASLLVFEDQLAALENDSQKLGTTSTVTCAQSGHRAG
jgi:hypothetical protein